MFLASNDVAYNVSQITFLRLADTFSNVETMMTSYTVVMHGGVYTKIANN